MTLMRALRLASTLPSASLFTASTAGELRRWTFDRIMRGPITRQCWNSRGAGSGTLFSVDGKSLFAPADERSVVILDGPSLEPKESVVGIRRVIGRFAQKVWGISADGLSLSSWNLETHTIEDEIGRSPAAIVNAVLSDNGQRICFVRTSGELCVAELDGSGALFTAAAPITPFLWSLTLDSTATPGADTSGLG